MVSELRVRFSASGHPNVRAAHKTTLEITSESSLSERGDCIVAVGSDLTAAGLPEEVKEKIRSGARVTLTISAGQYVDVVKGFGDPGLVLDGKKGMIFRKSGYLSPDTVAVKCDKSAANLDRGLVEELKKAGHVEFELKVEFDRD
ncbi:MAG: DUF371 domain-containing protein [Candidatus Marsarchaeota archaeon]